MSRSLSVGLLALALLCSHVSWAEPKWVPGRHYSEIAPPVPGQRSDGQVKITEVFWYSCSDSIALEPYLQNWLKTKPSYIRLERLPAQWLTAQQADARMFYTLMTLERMDLHSSVFTDIREIYLHPDPGHRGEVSGQRAFATKHGILAADFDRIYASPSVDEHLNVASQIVMRYGVSFTPSFIIDDRYTTDPKRAGGNENLLELIEYLAAKEQLQNDEQDARTTTANH